MKSSILNPAPKKDLSMALMFLGPKALGFGNELPCGITPNHLIDVSSLPLLRQRHRNFECRARKRYVFFGFPSFRSSFQYSMDITILTKEQLRERLQIEKKALAGADSTLQAEISLLGEEIASLRPSAIKGRPSSSGGAPNSSNSITSLLGRVRTLESKVATLSSNLGARIVALEKDVENSLLMNERRVRKLDELYRETTAENEALRERFKGDLSKVAKEAQLGSIENALRSQLKEALDEALLLKKENARQKREIISLKAQPTASAIRGKDLKAMNETRR